MLLGLLKTTLRSSDLLEELTELRKAVILRGVVYYTERIQIKNSKGKRYRGQSLGETRHKLLVVLSQCGWCKQHLTLLATPCDLRSIANQGSSPKPSVEGFGGGQPCRLGEPIYLLSYSVSSPSRCQTDTTWTRPPPHITLLV